MIFTNFKWYEGLHLSKNQKFEINSNVIYLLDYCIKTQKNKLVIFLRRSHINGRLKVYT